MKEVETRYPGINACYGFFPGKAKEKPPTKIEVLQETICLYAEAVEDMTAHRNELERELLRIYGKLDSLYKEVRT